MKITTFTLALLLAGTSAQGATILLDYNDGVAGGGHDAAVRDGDFENSTVGGNALFNEMPDWTNLSGAQTAEMTLTNLASGVGGARNFAVGTNITDFIERAPGQDMGHTIALGDTFVASFMWRSAFKWASSDQISMVLYYTVDNTLAGAATDLISLDSASNTSATWLTESLASTGFADPGAVGKNLFVRFDNNTVSGDEHFARMDNAFLEVSAIPEPSLIAMVSLGFVGLFIRRRR